MNIIKESAESKNWVEAAVEFSENKGNESLAKGTEKLLDSIKKSYQRMTLTEGEDITEDNFDDYALRSVCSRLSYNYDKAKDYLLNKK